MKITKLPAGEIAPKDSDCIKIERTAGGRFTMVTSALSACDDETGESEAVISGESYDTYEAAEGAGLAWAESLCVDAVFIETAA